MRLHLYDLIETPWITEKGTKQWPKGKYSFRVRPSATKVQIKHAVEEIYKVNVVKVNTVSVHGRWKRVRMHPGKTSEWKKAVVTLKPGQKIEFQ